MCAPCGRNQRVACDVFFLPGSAFVGEMAGVLLEREVVQAKDSLHWLPDAARVQAASAGQRLADRRTAAGETGLSGFTLQSPCPPGAGEFGRRMSKDSPHASIILSNDVWRAGTCRPQVLASKRRCATCGAPYLRSAVCASCAVRCVHATLSENFTTARSSASLRA